MQCLDVIFANRWLQACHARHTGSKPTPSIIDSSVDKARGAAWSFAGQVSKPAGDSRTRAIDEKDGEVVLLSEHISHPGITLPMLPALIRVGERGTVRERIGILQ